MEDSILISTRKILGLYTNPNVQGGTPPAFELDVLTHINSTFAVLEQLGVGPLQGFFVSDQTALWSQLPVLPKQLALIKTYMFLKVKLLFDPPETGYGLTAAKDQIKELEWRLANSNLEGLVPAIPEETP